jgi:hypothetical protein
LGGRISRRAEDNYLDGRIIKPGGVRIFGSRISRRLRIFGWQDKPAAEDIWTAG